MELREGLYINKSNIWNIWMEDELEFYRSPFQCLGTFEGKIRYSIASLCSYRENGEEIFDSIAKIVYEMIPEIKKIKLPKQRYGDDDEVSYGGVDKDILTGFLQDENIDLKEFLINKKYVVIVDGDEYRIWDDIKKSGLANREDISSEYPSLKYPEDDE